MLCANLSVGNGRVKFLIIWTLKDFFEIEILLIASVNAIKAYVVVVKQT